jgi:nucleoside-diphosphate-sugar epimerase
MKNETMFRFKIINMDVLITGAFGFVGSNLSASICNLKNTGVIAVDIAESKPHCYNSFIPWDQTAKIEKLQLDAIIHLAGKAHDTKNTTDENEYFDVNLGLTRKIFEVFIKSSAHKFIFFSSVKAVADKVITGQLTEDEVPNPQTAYGKSKLAAENYILNQTLPVGKKVYILRPCMIHGPGNKGNLNLLFKIVQTGIPWPLGSFGNSRSFTSIDNLAFVVKQILENEIMPGVYNVADDEVLSTNGLIELIAASQNKKPRIWALNKKLIVIVAKIGDKLSLPLNSERLGKLTESYIVSNQKLKNALGVKVMPVGAVEGMEKTLASFRK